MRSGKFEGQWALGNWGVVGGRQCSLPPIPAPYCLLAEQGGTPFSERISPFIGRIVIAFFFLSEAWMKLTSFDATVMLLRNQNIPAAAPLLVLALAVILLGGLSLILGYLIRHGALLLFALTAIVTVLLHAYWTITDSAGRAAEFEIFIRNVAIAGGLLLIVGMGPGPFAVDNIGAEQ